MNTIYKYVLEPKVIQHVRLPHSHRLITVQMQTQEAHGVGMVVSRSAQVCLWAQVDTSDLDEVDVEIIACGTGNELPDNAGPYLGTVQNNGIVMHYFAGVR